MTARHDVVVVGDVNPDLILTGDDPTPRFGQAEIVVDGATFGIGGSAAITATALARLGLRCALVGTVGDDDLGRLLLDRLAAEGVDITGVERRPGESTGISVHLAGGGDRAIITHIGAMAATSGRQVPDELLASTGQVHLAGLFLLPGLRASAADLLRRAGRLGCRRSVDPNWDPSGRWDLDDVLDQVDLVLVNQAEALGLSGRHRDDEALGLGGRRRDDEALAALRSRVATVVVKGGGAGAVVATGDSVVCLPAPEVAVVDTVGAGDSFDAGFLAATVAGASPTEALALGLAVGSLSVGGAGGTGARWTAGDARRLAAAVTPTRR